MATGRVHATYTLEGNSLEEFEKSLEEIPMDSMIIVDNLLKYIISNKDILFSLNYLMPVINNSIYGINYFIKHSGINHIVGFKSKMIDINQKEIDGIHIISPLFMEYTTGSSNAKGTFFSGYLGFWKDGIPEKMMVGYVSYMTP